MLSGAGALGERKIIRKVNGEDRAAVYPAAGNLPEIIAAFEQVKRASNKAEIVRLIAEHDLPRETVPTRWLNEPEVWEALLERMPMTAMLRNLGKMSAVGLVNPFSDATKLVLNRLRDHSLLQRARIHPLAVLIAQRIYARGRGEKGDLTWKAIPQVIDALDVAFYATFKNIEPCGKPVLLALDVSSSMDGSRIAGSCLTAREASAAMALVTAATEPEFHIMGFSDRFMPLNISPRMRLDSVVKAISSLPFMGTDCALPMVWARENKLEVSAFVTYTDSETWAGNIHPAQALRQYREQFVPDAKAVVVGMTSNGFTLADPNDRGMLDVVGFDTSVPAVIADFIRN
jgi:60 kDa SS-A/Ro ribonucleoprotein